MLREDCFYYYNDHDMHATIPSCSKHLNEYYFKCENCKNFISKKEAHKVVDDYVKRRGGVNNEK